MRPMNIATEPRPRPAVGEWLWERLGLEGLAYSVPQHANRLPYTLGGITLTGFVILFLTGIYLAQFYHPHPTEAHASVVYIITGAPLGDLVRSIHFWTAQIVTVTVLLHMLRVLFTGSYKRPREVNWYVAEMLGLLGGWFSAEFSRSVPLVTRLFNGHIAILPLLFALLIASHIYLVKQHGISPKVTKDALSRATAGEGESFFSIHLKRMAGYGLLVLSASVLLSLVFPAPLGQPGVAGAEVTKPWWMFIWLFPAEEAWGVAALAIIPAIVGLLLALVPILDRSPHLSPARRKLLLVTSGVILLAIVVSGLVATLQPLSAHLE